MDKFLIFLTPQSTMPSTNWSLVLNCIYIFIASKIYHNYEWLRKFIITWLASGASGIDNSITPPDHMRHLPFTQVPDLLKEVCHSLLVLLSLFRYVWRKTMNLDLSFSFIPLSGTTPRPPSTIALTACHSQIPIIDHAEFFFFTIIFKDFTNVCS